MDTWAEFTVGSFCFVRRFLQTSFEDAPEHVIDCFELLSDEGLVVVPCEDVKAHTKILRRTRERRRAKAAPVIRHRGA